MTPKNAAAVALGRKGGKATAEKRTAEERSAAARKAVEARWARIDASLKEMKEGLAKLEAKQRARVARTQGAKPKRKKKEAHG